jgi:ubiquinone/menaquinone biosynthesis C-methylase UbiE
MAARNQKAPTLDLGCGTGFVFDVLPDCNLTGIDISPGMLDRNPYKDKCICGSAEELTRYYRPNSFDHIICRALLHHLQNPRKAIEGMSEVLKAGGTASILETNSSIINRVPRELLKLTGRFSKGHRNFEFKELKEIVETKFTIESVKFIGFIAYPLVGFPDFINIPLPKGVAEWLIKADDKLAKTPLKTMAFNILIQARKK